MDDAAEKEIPHSGNLCEKYYVNSWKKKKIRAPFIHHSTQTNISLSSRGI